ncbi:MAG: fimbrillin family protein, partial [Tannerellaceae bacterium]
MRGLLTSAFFISVIIIGYAAEKEKVQLKRLFEPDNQSLIVTTRTLTSQSATLVQEFAQNAIIGLHATSGTPGNLYNGKSEYNNIKLKATSLKHRRINWQQTPKVMLTSKAATIYAYAPYQALYPFNPNRIPIKIAADANYTPDYMYGRQAVGQKAVSQISPYAQLQMKYALVRVTFEVCGEGINDSSYSISSIQISNRAGGNLLHSAGTMNIATGQITPDIDTTIPTLLTLVHPMALGTKRVKTENGSLSS